MRSAGSSARLGSQIATSRRSSFCPTIASSPKRRGRRRSRAMSLHAKLRARAEAGSPVRVGLIGAGKFGSMFLAQAPRTPGLHVMAVADLSPARAREALRRVGWTEEQAAAGSFADAQ